MNRSYRTSKGTELPLLSLRGKEYLEVKYRLVWFREEHPDWSIETELMNVTDVSASARAVVKDENGRVIATSHKFESRQGFPDFIEKAETGAIGRALALIGYGTQFCADELDEGDRIVDAPAETVRRFHSHTSSGQNPVVRKPAAKPTPVAALKSEPTLVAKPIQGANETSAKLGFAEVENEVETQSDSSGNDNVTKFEPGEYRISFGRKYKGKKLKEIARAEIEGYLEWLEDSANKKGMPLSEEARYLKMAVDRYLEAAAH